MTTNSSLLSHKLWFKAKKEAFSNDYVFCRSNRVGFYIHAQKLCSEDVPPAGRRRMLASSVCPHITATLEDLCSLAAPTPP